MGQAQRAEEKESFVLSLHFRSGARAELTIGATMQGLVALSIDGKVKDVAFKVLVPEIIQHLLDGLGVKKS